ncbi:DsbA family protein [Candidatus Gottesmanbacteria bacterium]|nr:DsbA family protein [Candidatus Gottesmanbacteria bacterium]
MKLSSSPILVVILIIASFVIGSLYTKVGYLEKGTTSGSANPQVSVGASQPNPRVAAPNTPAAPVAYGSADQVEKLKSTDHLRGDRKARILLIEYSDHECPFCKRFHPTAQKIVDTYKGQVAWVYRQFPLSFHTNAQKEAEASECVNELGGNDAFWKFVDAIFARTISNGTGFALDKLGPLAQEIGVDQTKFKSCLDSGKYSKYVQDDETAGTKAGVTGTPGNILLDTKTGKTQSIPGAVPFEQFKDAIDQMLKES